MMRQWLLRTNELAPTCSLENSDCVFAYDRKTTIIPVKPCNDTNFNKDMQIFWLILVECVLKTHCFTAISICDMLNRMGTAYLTL